MTPLDKRVPGRTLAAIIPPPAQPLPVNFWRAVRRQLGPPIRPGPSLPALASPGWRRRAGAGGNLVNTLRQHRSATFWDDMYSAPDIRPAPIPRAEIGQFQDRVAASAGPAVIDVGTGLGEWACRMSKLGLTVTGYDYSPVAIESARRLHHNHGPLTFEVHDFDADAIPRHLQRESVDVVSCRHVLHFLERPRFIADARRWLHKNGVLHITTAVAEKMRDGRHVGLREAEVRELARGWREYDRYDVDPHGEITAVVLRGPYT
ncbi:class I SAM-dependent methyltransferase [Streptomyces sp. NPDC056632]|uniref:class I SAM-dependent methyltransferase n=1 Tax=Streptomyces sp. NPDC056632 TaxID=3345884 RepID=UPI0036B200FC